MKKKRNKLFLVALTLITASYLLLLSLHIFYLDKDASKNIYAGSKPLPVKITEGWMYKWGDSPVDANGSFTWLRENTGGWETFEFPGRPQNPDN